MQGAGLLIKKVVRLHIYRSETRPSQSSDKECNSGLRLKLMLLFFSRTTSTKVRLEKEGLVRVYVASIECAGAKGGVS